MPDAPPSPVAPAPLPGPWRIGSHYGIHVYEDQRPVATFHTVLDAKAAVRAYNASLATPAPAPVAERIAELEEHLRGAYRQNPKPPGDWACAECRPDSELTAKGFRCWWHVGESLARAATTEGEGT